MLGSRVVSNVATPTTSISACQLQVVTFNFDCSNGNLCCTQFITHYRMHSIDIVLSVQIAKWWKHDFTIWIESILHCVIIISLLSRIKFYLFFIFYFLFFIFYFYIRKWCRNLLVRLLHSMFMRGSYKPRSTRLVGLLI